MLHRVYKALVVVLVAGSGVPLARAQSLTTGLPNILAGGGVFLNLTPANQSLYLNAITAYYAADAGEPLLVDVRLRRGSYVGHTEYVDGWTLSETLSGTSPGPTEPCTLTLATPILIPAGMTTGLYLHGVSPNGGMQYTCHFTNPQTWSNADITLFSDQARSRAVPFAGTLGCGTFAGTIYYSPADLNELRACCFADGACQTINPSACLAQGGNYLAAGSTCGSGQCPQPAACCFADGTCAVMLQSSCIEQRGVFTAGADCMTAACPQPPTGACCLPNSTCVLTWLGGCTVQGGVYGGDNTTCAEPNCASVVVPNQNETAEGGSSDFNPFSHPLHQYTRYQQVYGAEAFASLNGPHRIRAIQFRPNASLIGLNWHSSFDLELRMSTTTAAAPDWISYNFATNVGPNETVVYEGPVFVSTGQAGRPTGPMLFDLVINLQTPFVYDPAQGNLLIDAIVEGALCGNTRYLDSVVVEGDPVSRVLSHTPGAANGIEGTPGLVTRFVVEQASDPCYANCDGSTAAPILNVLDFNCFLNHFSQGDSYANCDESTSPPVLNVLDFNCFLNRFTGGCP